MTLFKPMLALALSFIVTALLGMVLIPFLRKLKYGQSILEIGPAWHKGKQGTPTMGGIMFICGIITGFAVFGWQSVIRGDYLPAVALLISLIFGVIGFLDDYIKVVKKRNLGLTALQKIILQGLTATAFVIFLALNFNINTMVYIPFFEKPIDLGWAYYVFSLLIIVYTVNCVNLTDGLDGLATSIMIPVSLFFLCAALRLEGQGEGMAIYSAAVAGGVLGFLIFNFHPAKIFMGDTGSLFLGGVLCTLAFSLNMPVIILLVGFVYLFEGLSVMLQVLSFKLTGKRIFKMSPLHHHFEMSGWGEVKIVYVFTVVTVIFCIIAYLSITNSYVK